MNLDALIMAQARPTKNRREALQEIMADKQAHTLSQLAAATGYSSASISAELRDWRRLRGLNVIKEHVQSFKHQMIFGYRLAEGTPTLRATRCPAALALLREVRAYLAGFTKLDPEGQRLLAAVKEFNP